ncbi:MAG: 2'-5' RNA ligase family protein [Chitinophagaceae bacterium]|nr:2'-5' RNA ligase family protein [Chitinophagaceae bacterium]
MSSAMYYIAILAPGEVNEKILQWKHFMRDRFGCIAALKSPAHITLISPFWMNKDFQFLLENNLKEFSNNQESFLIELTDFGSFKPRVIFVHVKQSDHLTILATALQNALLKNPLFSIKESIRQFHAHITIANRDLHKNDFNTAWEYFKHKKYQASFPARGITLMKHTGLQWEPACTAVFPLV